MRSCSRSWLTRFFCRVLHPRSIHTIRLKFLCILDAFSFLAYCSLMARLFTALPASPAASPPRFNALPQTLSSRLSEAAAVWILADSAAEAARFLEVFGFSVAFFPKRSFLPYAAFPWNRDFFLVLVYPFSGGSLISSGASLAAPSAISSRKRIVLFFFANQGYSCFSRSTSPGLVVMIRYNSRSVGK